jgi:hypothetical protein
MILRQWPIQGLESQQKRGNGLVPANVATLAGLGGVDLG